MGFRKFIFAAFVVLEGCCVSSQYVQASGKCPCVSSSPAMPSGPFVIPAIIKPILQPEPVAMPCPAPIVPTYSDAPVFAGLPSPYQGGFPAPYPGMPPIILENDDDRSQPLLYYLLFALSKRNKCGGNGCGNCGDGCGCNGNGCGVGYGSCGGCGNCGSFNSGCTNGCNSGCSYNNCGCGGFGFNNGCGANYGSCGCSGFNGNGCSNGCTYVPYPIPFPCGSSTGFPTLDYGCGCSNDNSCSCNQGNQAPEINVIIRTQDDSCSSSSSTSSTNTSAAAASSS